MPDFILASSSPRRRRFLEDLGLRFSLKAAEVEEIPQAGESPEDFALRAARDKALEVSKDTLLPVLGADTVVAVDGRILGKPRDTREADEMLHLLSGRKHLVHTAMALACGSEIHTLLDTTEVQFLQLNGKLIEWYISTGEPMDKAGAYAVQGAGGLLVSSIQGAPQTVIGLPIHRMEELFGMMGLDFQEMLNQPAY